jgi:general secretion pathway protein D
MYFFLTRLFFSVLFCVLAAGPVLLGPADSTAAGSKTAGSKTDGKSSQRFVTIDFNDVDINLFIKYISELSGKNFVVDRSVKGKVTIISPTRISEEDAYRVFESVLEVHGYTTVPSGSIIKIVPAVQARSKSIATIMEGEGLSTEDKVVTRIIPLAYSDPNELKKILAPLVSKTSVVIAHPQSGMLIITDVLSNINRLMDIIRVVDVPSVGEELEIIPLEHASASNVAKSISQLFIRSAKKGARPGTIKIIPYERTNSLIVFAPRTQIKKIRSLLERLDSEVPRGGGKIHVYYLQHANAEELVKVLTNLPDKQAAGKTKGKLPPLSNDLKITADAETNALIITAPREEYLVLEDVIKKLDIPRRMVYLEALIMEVQVTKDFKIGVEWGGGGTFADDTGAMIGGFTSNLDKPFDVLDGISKIPPAMPGGFTLGVLKKGVEIGGIYFPNLGAVLNAFQNDSDINIIATPQILTTDNKKASIVVGENVPYLTSQNTTDALQNYSNYEYKDVATTLEITPQINQADLVRLDIGVEVIKLKDTNNFRPTTFKRKAETTVVVHNEETVVIGGIIGQDTTTGEYKVPLLGDIPLLGWLFKSHGNKQAKTNLFIFITPHIVESSPELAALYYKKRDVMEYVQKGSSEIPDRFFHGKPNPEHATALADMGFAKLQKKEYDKAKAYFDQALKINPDNPYALINLGVIYEHEGNKEMAAEKYRQVLDLAGQEVGEGAEPPRVEQALQNAARENLRLLERRQQ